MNLWINQHTGEIVLGTYFDNSRGFYYYRPEKQYSFIFGIELETLNDTQYITDCVNQWDYFAEYY